MSVRAQGGSSPAPLDFKVWITFSSPGHLMKLMVVQKVTLENLGFSQTYSNETDEESILMIA